MRYLKEPVFDLDPVKTFKAGDFTKGKMKDIFINCYQGDVDCVRIRHESFGDSYLIPVNTAKVMCLGAALKDESLSKYIGLHKDDESKSILEFSMENETDYIMHLFCDYFEIEFMSWFELLIFMTTGDN